MLYILFYLSIFFTGLIYAGFIFYCIRGWNKLPVFTSGKQVQNIKFSIIIPARNEAESIANCINSIAQQTYNKANFEVILVDDISEDETVKIATETASRIQGLQFHILHLEKMLPAETIAFKKFGIQKAVETSRNEWIITTDADCTHNQNWLQTLADFISENNAVLVSGPVQLQSRNNFFENAQALEFSGLIGIGAASISNGKPNMCNGANLCYKKEAFFEVGGYAGIDTIASGDDELLMHKIHVKFPGKVFFIKSIYALVQTPALHSLKAFLSQRRRWASKARFYKDPTLKLLLALVYIFHVLLVAGVFLSIFFKAYIWIFMAALALKTFPEWCFLYKINSFFGREKIAMLYPLVLPAQVLYVVFIGIYGNFGRYTWKGRKVQ